MTLTLFDAVGRTLRAWSLRPQQAAQSVAWDGTTASGSPAPSGLYVVRLSAGDRVLDTEKVTRLR